MFSLAFLENGATMRVSQLFGETLRHPPAETDIASHQLLLQAGYVRQLAAGIFSYLPLAWRAVRKIEQILREEMNAIGGQELNMPVVHPAELWQQSGRWETIDETMVRFRDRRGHPMLLAMTHEEVVAQLAASEIRSYRQLPQLVYQIQTKFRDEPRARGGLIRVREFLMKDSYSLDKDEEGLKKQYIAHYNAYFRIGARVGLSLLAVGSDVGMMGGKLAHEFMYLTDIGEDTLVVCEQCGYAANQEVATFRKVRANTDPPRPLERVATPGTTTIESLAAYLGIPASSTAKAVFFMGTFAPPEGSNEGGFVQKLVVALVRGDMETNQTLVKNSTHAIALRPAHPEEILEAGMVPGYASPVGIPPGKALVIADDLLVEETNLVAGANEEGYHLRNVCCGRDFQPDIVANIAQAGEGALCIRCGTPLSLKRGVEVGNIFQLGTRYSVALQAFYTDEDGNQKPIVMGSYGIGVGRLLACVAEAYRDEKGLIWPISVAPYALNLIGLCRAPENIAKTESLYAALQQAGVETLYDDREVSPGVKFADADLRGMPLQIVISERSLQQGGVELRRRDGTAKEIVPLADAPALARQQVDAMQAALSTAADAAPKWPSGEQQ
jgi:prolyl-tRNA synthetase